MMAGEGRQDKNRIFVGDQLEGLFNPLHRAVEFRAKPSALLTVRLDLPIQAGRMLTVPAYKKFVLQIGQSHPILGRKPVVFRKGNVTTCLCQLSRVKFAG
jgi:hypothetical protein